MNECKICLETDKDENMISPCNCNGTNKYVHSECLNKWRLVSQQIRRCYICNSEYNEKKQDMFSLLIPYLIFLYNYHILVSIIVLSPISQWYIILYNILLLIPIILNIFILKSNINERDFKCIAYMYLLSCIFLMTKIYLIAILCNKIIVDVYWCLYINDKSYEYRLF